MRAAPQNRRVTLMARSRGFLPQRRGENAVERDGIGRMRHTGRGADRAQSRAQEAFRHVRRKQRVRDNGVDDSGAGSSKRFDAGNQRAA